MVWGSHYSQGVEQGRIIANHVGTRRNPRAIPSTRDAPRRSGATLQRTGVQIFVRSCETRLYLGSENEWSLDVSLARCFTSALDAELFCRENGFTCIELLVRRQRQPPLIIPLRLP